MSQIKKKTTELATYQERTDSHTRKDVYRLMMGSIHQYENGVDNAEAATKLLISSAKHFWKSGKLFTEAEEINQLEFKTFTCDIKGWQQEYVRRQKIAVAIKIYHACESEPSALDDCRAVIQPCLIAAGAISESKRLKAQVAHGKPNLWTELVSVLANFESTVENIFKETPLEEMDRLDLEKFIKVTEPIKLKHETAKEFLAEKS